MFRRLGSITLKAALVAAIGLMAGETAWARGGGGGGGGHGGFSGGGHGGFSGGSYGRGSYGGYGRGYYGGYGYGGYGYGRGSYSYGRGYYGGYGYGGYGYGRGYYPFGYGYGYGPGYFSSSYPSGYGYGNDSMRYSLNDGYSPSATDGFSVSPGYAAAAPATPRPVPVDRAPAVPDSSAMAGQSSPSKGMPVVFEVRVPENAEIWFNGARTKQTGTIRKYSSPPLAAGKAGTYDIRCRWEANGQSMEQTRQVTVHAGDRLSMNFLK